MLSDWEENGDKESPKRPHRWVFLLLILCLLALLPRLWLASMLHPSQVLYSVDAKGFHILAVNLLQGHGFSMRYEAPYVPENVRTPVYPAFVAAVYYGFGQYPYGVILIQTLLDVMTTVLIYRLGQLIAGDLTGLLAGFIYALTPAAWRFTNELLAEILLTLLLCAALYTFLRGLLRVEQGTFALSGLLMGLAILCKPNVQWIPLLLLLGLAWHLWRSPPRFLRAGGLFLTGLALIILPWFVRNRLLFGRWLLSATFEVNIARVSAVATLAELQHTTVAPWTPAWEAIFYGIVEQAAVEYDWPPANDEHKLSAQQLDKRRHEVARVALRIIRQHPWAFLRSHVKGVLHSLMPTEYKFWYEKLSGQSWESLGVCPGMTCGAIKLMLQGHLHEGLQLIWQERWIKLPWLARLLWVMGMFALPIGAVLALLSLLRLWRQPSVAFIFWSLIIYILFLPGPISYVRFQVPGFPFISVLKGVGIVVLVQSRSYLKRMQR